MTEIDHEKMIDQAMKGLGIPEGTSLWPYPHKPLGKPTGAAKGQAKGPRGKSTHRAHKTSRGTKHRKSGADAGTIFAGWD